MESLGHYLKIQRKLRNISLEEVSRVSKVAPNWLELLERDAFDKLPGEIFTKGYLRLYADAIGLDADDIVLRYELQSRVEEECTLRAVPFWRRKDARRLALFIFGMGAMIYWVITRFIFVPQLTRHL